MIRKAVIVVLTLGAAGMGALWVLFPSIPSYPWHIPNVSTGDTPELNLTPFSGGLVLAYGISLEEEPPGIKSEYAVVRERLGFEFNRTWSVPNPPPFVNLWSARAPFWSFIFLFLTYPTIAFIRGPLRRWRRRRRGLCRKFGYNLTGNTTGVCSECGAAVNQP